MAKNGTLKNKLNCLLSATDTDSGKLLSISSNGAVELIAQSEPVEPGANRITLSSETIDYISATGDLSIENEPITRTNFYDKEFLFIYDPQTLSSENIQATYKYSLYKPYRIIRQYTNNIRYDYYIYIGVNDFFYIMESNGVYYYKFTSNYALDYSNKHNLTFI